jgi:hypothetical protein
MSKSTIFRGQIIQRGFAAAARSTSHWLATNTSMSETLDPTTGMADLLKLEPSLITILNQAEIF